VSAEPRARRLPLLIEGEEHLGFRCNGCADCCRNLRVAVTHHDVARLVAATERPASELVQWLSAREVEMAGEPGTLVELRAGRRLMVLAHSAGGACVLLDAANRCGAYGARPYDCQLYPFDVVRDAAGDVTRLARLDRDGCGEQQDTRADLAELIDRDAARWRELAEYQARVARWNQLAAHRRRFRRRLGEAEAFLTFLGFEPAASAPAAP
jgi:Fe-S-cluster containining protein